MFVAIAVAVAAVGLNWARVSGAVSDLAGMVEGYAVLGVVLIAPVVAAILALRHEPSPDRYYWIAIILLAPVLGPLAFLVFRLMARPRSRERASAIGFRSGTSRRDQGRGPAAHVAQPHG